MNRRQFVTSAIGAAGILSLPLYPTRASANPVLDSPLTGEEIPRYRTSRWYYNEDGFWFYLYTTYRDDSVFDLAGSPFISFRYVMHVNTPGDDETITLVDEYHEALRNYDAGLVSRVADAAFEDFVNAYYASGHNMHDLSYNYLVAKERLKPLTPAEFRDTIRE